jgi:hypothetical protein
VNLRVITGYGLLRRPLLKREARKRTAVAQGSKHGQPSCSSSDEVKVFVSSARCRSGFASQLISFLLVRFRNIRGLLCPGGHRCSLIKEGHLGCSLGKAAGSLIWRARQLLASYTPRRVPLSSAWISRNSATSSFEHPSCCALTFSDQKNRLCLVCSLFFSLVVSFDLLSYIMLQ